MVLTTVQPPPSLGNKGTSKERVSKTEATYQFLLTEISIVDLKHYFALGH